jgi:Tfp pilus assembly protein PilN
MKTSPKPVKHREERAQARAILTLPRPQTSGNMDKTQDLKTEKDRANDSTNQEQPGGCHPTWEVHLNWPDLFTIFKRADNDKKWRYEVRMAESLNERFSALRRPYSDSEVAKLSDALHLLHLCCVDDNQFGSPSELIQCLEGEDSPNLAHIDPFSFSRLLHLLKAIELLKCSLSGVLADLVYTNSSAAPLIDKLRKRFARALKLLPSNPNRPAQKQRAEFYPYGGRWVSLAWLAIELAYLFVRDHHKLPTKIELREFAQKAVREEAKKIAEIAQAGKEAERASKEGARANKEAERAAQTVANMNKGIPRSTWAGALKNAGLSKLPEGAKFSGSRYQKKAVWQNIHSAVLPSMFNKCQ